MPPGAAGARLSCQLHRTPRPWQMWRLVPCQGTLAEPSARGWRGAASLRRRTFLGLAEPSGTGCSWGPSCEHPAGARHFYRSPAAAGRAEGHLGPTSPGASVSPGSQASPPWPGRAWLAGTPSAGSSGSGLPQPHPCAPHQLLLLTLSPAGDLCCLVYLESTHASFAQLNATPPPPATASAVQGPPPAFSHPLLPLSWGLGPLASRPSGHLAVC